MNKANEKQRAKIKAGHWGKDGFWVHTEGQKDFHVSFMHEGNKQKRTLRIKRGQGRIELDGKQAQILWRALNEWKNHKDPEGDNPPSAMIDVQKKTKTITKTLSYCNELNIYAHDQSRVFDIELFKKYDQKLPRYTRISCGAAQLTLTGKQTNTVWCVLNKYYGSKQAMQAQGS
jgi:hypothetical protein